MHDAKRNPFNIANGIKLTYTQILYNIFFHTNAILRTLKYNGNYVRRAVGPICLLLLSWKQSEFRLTT